MSLEKPELSSNLLYNLNDKNPEPSLIFGYVLYADEQPMNQILRGSIIIFKLNRTVSNRACTNVPIPSKIIVFIIFVA